MPAPNLPSFRDLPLPGGFILPGITLVPGPMIDPIGRPALAKTVIEGQRIAIVLGPRSNARLQPRALPEISRGWSERSEGEPPDHAVHQTCAPAGAVET